MRRALIAPAIAALILALASSPARAITYGSPDGNGHPNVGGLVVDLDGEKFLICSGTLISPTVFLTASHCTAFLPAEGITTVWVTFDPQFTSSSTLYEGTPFTNPGYNQSQSDPGDIAVVVLSNAVVGITPASLPPAGLFDQMKDNGVLHDQQFTAVGYGGHAPTVGGGPPVFEFLDIREVAVSSFNALNKAWLRLSQNNAHGDGGTCFGDSGGPTFLGAGSGETDIVAAITITGDAMCFATNVDYRLDTDSARAFLQDFVELP